MFQLLYTSCVDMLHENVLIFCLCLLTHKKEARGSEKSPYTNQKSSVSSSSDSETESSQDSESSQGESKLDHF